MGEETEPDKAFPRTLPGCLHQWASSLTNTVASLCFLSCRHWDPAGRCSRNGPLEKRAFPDPPPLTPGRIRCAQLNGIISSFLGCFDYSDLLKHKKSCGTAD